MSIPSVDVVIPARAGSVGLPGKNRRILGDRALFLHSVAFAHEIPSVRRILVSTDDPEIAGEAVKAGAFVPELRPPQLATSEVGMAEVIRYCCAVLKADDSVPSNFVLLLDPTSPLRRVDDVQSALNALGEREEAAGAISISRPAFNPLWVGVDLGDDGLLRRHPLTPTSYSRRQDVPDYMRINGSFYVWRERFACDLQSDWLDRGDFVGIETPEIRSHSIDVEEDFMLVQALLAAKLVHLPWMGPKNA